MYSQKKVEFDFKFSLKSDGLNDKNLPKYLYDPQQKRKRTLEISNLENCYLLFKAIDNAAYFTEILFSNH